MLVDSSPRRAGSGCCGGFTLVELLVVISIIAMLIALLLPVLGKVRYRARIIQCLANERMMGVTVLAYAQEFKQAYPYRALDAVANDQHFQLARFVGGAWDDRPMFRSFMNIDQMLVCPISPLAAGASLNSNTSQFTMSSYDLWFGSRITSLPGGGMLRVGDRPTYFDGAATRTFNVLACDIEREWDGHAGLYNILSAHPDETGTLSLMQTANTLIGAWTYTSSNWALVAPNSASLTRGPVERNFIFDDGSANTRRTTFRDPSMVRVPASVFMAGEFSIYAFLPALD